MSREGKRTRSVESRRRASAYLGTLAWLAGFPAGERWLSLDGRAIAIDGDLVARSRRTARMLLREHRDALPALVGDVDRWWEIVDAILGWLGKRRGALDLIDRQSRRTAQAARELIARRPELREVVTAASVVYALDPERFAQAIAWLARHDVVIDVATTLQLARVPERGVEAVLALLAIDAPDPQPVMERIQSLVSRAQGSRGTDAPPSRRSRERTIAWLGELALRDAAEQGRALELLAAADLAAALAPWVEWERTAAPRIERASRFVARAHDPKEERDNVAGVALALRKSLGDTPPRLRLDEVLDAIDRLAGARFAAHHAAALRLLAAMPEVTPIERVRLVLHVERTAAYGVEDDDRKIAWLWEAIAAAFMRGAPPRVLGLWQDVLGGSKPYLEGDLLEACKTRADVERLVRVLAGLAEQPLPPGRLAPATLPSVEDGERASVLLAAGLPEAKVIEVVVELRDHRDTLREDMARAAVALAEDGDVAAQALALARLEGELEWTGARKLAELLAQVGEGAWFARAAIAAGQGAALASAATILAQLPRARWPKLVEARPAPWIARYPAALAPALTELAAVDPEAETTARRRLGDDLPDPEDLARELAVLRTKARSPSIEKRLANLEQRLATPAAPSPKRLANLAAKLAQTTLAIGLERFTSAITALASSRLLSGLGLAEWPAWASDRKSRDILFALLGLDAPDRALAGRLLRARSGPPPWDLRDDPANRAFLADLGARGLDPTAWLDSTPRTITAGDHKPLELSLCGDPVEVFAMGAHFDTCLAPDGSNFFSVVANAADINKRVLYARRDGRVVGRCLFALTDGHALLAFNPYCHERGLDFAVVARDFAVALAAKLRTRLVPVGTVSCLLARDWYDDGPRDLTGRFGSLDAVRIQLATIGPEHLVARVVEALAHPLDDVTLPLVLGCLDRRPELVVPLVPHVLAARAPATRIAAAQLAFRAGDLALADRLLGEHGAAIRLQHHAWPHGELLARLRPSYALARLRATRSRRVRGLADDSGDRIAVAAVALATLRRRKQAIALFRRAIEHEPYLRDELEQRMRELDQ